MDFDLNYCCVPGCEKTRSTGWTRGTLAQGRLRLPSCKEHRISDLPWVQFHYLICRLEGTSHNLAEMFAFAQAPQSNTDREFLMGHCNGSQFVGREAEGDYYRAVAEESGQSTTGKVYISGLARFPGDPQAWVSGKNDAERVLDERGWGASGVIKRNVSNIAEPSSPGVDPSLIAEEVEDIVASQVPANEQHLVDKIDLAEQVYNKRKPYWVKDGFDPEKMGLAEKCHE